MGYARSNGFRSNMAIDGTWQFRLDLDIKIDNLDCIEGGDFSSCDWVEHNCAHDEDIFLICTNGR